MNTTNQGHAAWADERFHAVEFRNQGAGMSAYRQCRCCGSFAMEGALSAHARWCDQQKKSDTLAAFDSLISAERRQYKEAADCVRVSAKSAI